ncbi:hypothetical protein PVAP13_6KG122906 [Panicum virgatum]|uniref:Uncharacterized protein n=1 Tax=Panicum virgatum TaxID=38727 RepID=A0A8T0RJE0_PANVG|nr:hypothetical protein PVAP13_6KG122906 [Panicum virgatum]
MCSGFRFHQRAHLQRGDPVSGICMWYAEAWIRSRWSWSRGHSCSSLVDFRVSLSRLSSLPVPSAIRPQYSQIRQFYAVGTVNRRWRGELRLLCLHASHCRSN